MLLSKATYNRCIQPWVQTQNNKNQASTIFFKKAKLQSAIGKCHISATKVLLFCFLSQVKLEEMCL